MEYGKPYLEESKNTKSVTMLVWLCLSVTVSKYMKY